MATTMDFLFERAVEQHEDESWNASDSEDEEEDIIYPWPQPRVLRPMPLPGHVFDSARFYAKPEDLPNAVREEDENFKQKIAEARLAEKYATASLKVANEKLDALDKESFATGISKWASGRDSEAVRAGKKKNAEKARDDATEAIEKAKALVKKLTDESQWIREHVEEHQRRVRIWNERQAEKAELERLVGQAFAE